MSKKVLFLTLETFRATGGVQRMNRTLAHSLHQLCEKNNWHFNIYALNDRQADLLPQYLPSCNFKGYNKNKAIYVLKSITSGFSADNVVLSHINLSAIGILIHLLNPKCKIWLIAHGIEIWHSLPFWKKAILKIADRIICVSSFTKSKVMTLHHADPERCITLNHILDPFIKLPAFFDKPEYLLARYKLKTNHKVIFTLTRMAATEQFKGYEQILKVVSNIKQTLPDIKYILAGPYDEAEKNRIQQLITVYDLSNHFILTGYIDDQELDDHFLLADLFVLPSKKEGFGIVFIEAMAFGLPVICGNVDGSTDAVRNERMGTRIDPDNMNELEQAIVLRLDQRLNIDERINIQQECLKYFNRKNYMNVIEKLIKDDTIA